MVDEAYERKFATGLLVALLALACLFFGLVAYAQQTPAPVTDPEWVVIFQVYERPPGQNHDGSEAQVTAVPFELRLVVRAKTEGAAAIAAKSHVDKFVVASQSDCIQFREAQQREAKR